MRTYASRVKLMNTQKSQSMKFYQICLEWKKPHLRIGHLANVHEMKRPYTDLTQNKTSNGKHLTLKFQFDIILNCNAHTYTNTQSKLFMYSDLNVQFLHPFLLEYTQRE